MDFENIINSTDLTISSEIHKRKINDFLGIIEGKLIFKNGTLDILEVIIVTDNQIFKKKYKYQLRSHTAEIIFRFDNAPHHQNVATYPHHKHLPDKIIESTEPDILQVLAEIKMLIKENDLENLE